jgi:septum formation protein
VTPKEAFRQRLVETRVRFKRLSNEDLEAISPPGEWRGKAGGYAIQGLAGTVRGEDGRLLYQCGRAAAV